MPNRDDGIIILHGIGRGSRSMNKMDRAFQHASYRTLNLDYPARHQNLDGLASDVAVSVAGWIKDLPGKVHFVTHSMGGLVARVMIARHRPENLGRVVKLGPPNQGSEVADLLVRTALYRKLFGPAGGELTTVQAACLGARLGPVDFPLGIIAGTRSVDPLSWCLLPKPNDGRVTVERTKIAGMADHLTLPVTHALMIQNPAVILAVARFIMSGSFASQI